MLDATQWGARAITGRPAAGTPTPERYEVPMLFLMGRYDLHTPYTTALARFERLEAPLMRFITFERSAHFVMLEEPGRFLMTLVREVLPLAGGRRASRRCPSRRSAAEGSAMTNMRCPADGREMIRRDIDRRPAASYRRCHGRWIPGRARTEATLAVLPMLFGS